MAFAVSWKSSRTRRARRPRREVEVKTTVPVVRKAVPVQDDTKDDRKDADEPDSSCDR
jgi:hypothetical protein